VNTTQSLSLSLSLSFPSPNRGPRSPKAAEEQDTAEASIVLELGDAEALLGIGEEAGDVDRCRVAWIELM
jgi:hypothetical protein